MVQVGVRQQEIDALLAYYKVLDLDVADPETVVANFNTEPKRTMELFDAAEEAELIEQVSGSLYELTRDGQEHIRRVLFRSARSKGQART